MDCSHGAMVLLQCGTKVGADGPRHCERAAVAEKPRACLLPLADRPSLTARLPGRAAHAPVAP